MYLVNEVEAQTVNPQFFHEAESLLAGVPKGATLSDLSDEHRRTVQGKLRQSIGNAVALGSRIANVKQLVEAFSRLVALERLAYGIGPEAEFADPLTELLRQIQGRARTFGPVADDPAFLPGYPPHTTIVDRPA